MHTSDVILTFPVFCMWTVRGCGGIGRQLLAAKSPHRKVRQMYIPHDEGFPGKNACLVKNDSNKPTRPPGDLVFLGCAAPCGNNTQIVNIIKKKTMAGLYGKEKCLLAWVPRVV